MSADGQYVKNTPTGAPDERARLILRTLVEEFIREGQPVGFVHAGFGPNEEESDVSTELGTTCALVPTTDEMAYAETNLTVRWYLKDAKRDPRFLLRRELQRKRVTNAYDVVLLDCPPFINISCVNALGASDYVLVPVLPSRPATA